MTPHAVTVCNYDMLCESALFENRNKGVESWMLKAVRRICVASLVIL